MSKQLLLVDSDPKSLRVTEVILKNAGLRASSPLGKVNGVDAFDKITLLCPTW